MLQVAQVLQPWAAGVRVWRDRADRPQVKERVDEALLEAVAQQQLEAAVQQQLEAVAQQQLEAAVQLEAVVQLGAAVQQQRGRRVKRVAADPLVPILHSRRLPTRRI